MKIKQSVVHRDNLPRFGRRLTEVPVGDDLPSPDEIIDELLNMSEILLGKRETPWEGQGYLDLMEIAAAFRGRALYLEQRILTEEQQGHVPRGHPYYRLRTGQIRQFVDLSKMMFDLGSRRLTHEALLQEQRYDTEDLS